MTVHPGLGNCIRSLSFAEAEQPAKYGSRGDFDQNHMVKTDRIECVGDLRTPLELISLGKRNEDCVNRQRWRTVGYFRLVATQPVCHSKDSTDAVWSSILAHT